MIDIETATREELAEELGAAGEYTMDWEMAEDLRKRLASADIRARRARWSF